MVVVAKLLVNRRDIKSVACGNCTKQSTMPIEKFTELERHKLLIQKYWVSYLFECRYCHFENQVTCIE